MPTRFSGTSPDLSVSRQATLAPRKISTPSSPPTVVSSSSSFASHKPDADVRRRSLQQAPGLVQPPVSWDPTGHYIHSGQTDGQSLMPRKNPYFWNKYNTETYVGHLRFHSNSS